MKAQFAAAALLCVALAGQAPKALMYADFTHTEGRVQSAHGGQVQLFGFAQNKKAPVSFTNSDGPAPHLPLIAPAEGSLPPRISFSFEIRPNNTYAGVVLQIKGQPEDASGKQVADDVTTYRTLTIEADFEGASATRVELISKDNGLELPDGQYPQATFKVSPGMQPYTIPLEWFKQPDNAAAKLDNKLVLQKLTAVQVVVPVVPSKGVVQVQRVYFSK